MWKAVFFICLAIVFIVLPSSSQSQVLGSFIILDTKIEEGEAFRTCPVMICDSLGLSVYDSIQVPNDRRIINTFNYNGNYGYVFRSLMANDVRWNQIDSIEYIESNFFIGVFYDSKTHIEYEEVPSIYVRHSILNNCYIFDGETIKIVYSHGDIQQDNTIVSCLSVNLVTFDFKKNPIYNSSLRGGALAIKFVKIKPTKYHLIVTSSTQNRILIYEYQNSSFNLLRNLQILKDESFQLAISSNDFISFDYSKGRLAFTNSWGSIVNCEIDFCFDSVRTVRHIDCGVDEIGDGLICGGSNSGMVYSNFILNSRIYNIAKHKVYSISLVNDSSQTCEDADYNEIYRFETSIYDLDSQNPQGFTSCVVYKNKAYFSLSKSFCVAVRITGGNSQYLATLEFDEEGNQGEFNLESLKLPGKGAWLIPYNPPFEPEPLVRAKVTSGISNNLFVCTGDSITLGSGTESNFLTYSWAPSTGLADPTRLRTKAAPNATTTYTLTVRLKPDAEHDCADRQSDTASVTVVVRNAPPPFSLGPDAALCPPQWPVQLAAPDAAPESNYAYRWSTGDTSKSIEVVSAGEYVLSITSADGFCSQADTVLLRAADLPTMPDWQSHYELCNESRQISLSVVPQPDFQYRWSDGSTETQRRFTATGNYVFSITTPEGCTDTISVSFTSYPKISLSADPEPDSDWCPRTDGSITLTTRPNRPQFRYTWNTGATGHRLEVDSAGLYRIRVQFSELCVDSAQLELSTLCLDAVFIPNAFSPNGDGLNEVWHVLGGPFSNFECTIYDRWGHTRFATTDVDRVWDGSGAPEGSYAVVVRYRLSGQRDVRQVVGTVQLVR